MRAPELCLSLPHHHPGKGTERVISQNTRELPSRQRVEMVHPAVTRQAWPCAACSPGLSAASGVGRLSPLVGVRPTNPLTGWDPRHSPTDSLRGGCALGSGSSLRGKCTGPGRCWAEGASEQFPLASQAGHLLAIFSFYFFLAVLLLFINGTFSCFPMVTVLVT